MMYMEATMRRTQIYIDPTQRKLLKEAALERHMSVSEIIREAISSWIRSNRKPKSNPLKGIVGLYRDASDSEGSVQHDDLYE